MATKRFTPLEDDPPSASSDDDETEDEQEIIAQKTIHESSSSSSSQEEEDDEDEEEEEEEEETTATEPVKIPLEKPKIPNPNSKPAELPYEEESDSDSEGAKKSTAKPKTISLNSSSIFEFDSDVRSPTASDFAIKPSKKINAFESTEKTPTSKRPSSGSEIKSRKKNKVSNGDADEEKKAVVKRIWSVDDELLLLQGFIDYQSKTGRSPLSDMDGFYKFTMSALPGYASKSQLYEKVRRLKKKFRVNSEKVSGNGGEEPAFSKPHERKLFELSNKIWGKDGCESVSAAGGGSNAKAKVRTPKVKTPKVNTPKVKIPKVKAPEVKPEIEVKEEDEDDGKIVKSEDFETLYPYWNAGLTSEVSSGLKFPSGVVDLVKGNFSLIGEAKAKELNEKWEALFENEAMLRKRRITLLSNIGDVETA